MGFWNWLYHWQNIPAFKMMSLFLFIADLLLKPREVKRFLFGRILGCFLVLLGGGLGVYFIFQAIVPLIGYSESGALLCAFLIVVGLLLIFLNRRKQIRPIDDITGRAHEIFENMNTGNLLKNNIHKILLFSFVAGLLLSQLKHPRQFLSHLKNPKNLCHLKDFLKSGGNKGFIKMILHLLD